MSGHFDVPFLFLFYYYIFRITTACLSTVMGVPYLRSCVGRQQWIQREKRKVEGGEGTEELRRELSSVARCSYLAVQAIQQQAAHALFSPLRTHS